MRTPPGLRAAPEERLFGIWRSPKWDQNSCCRAGVVLEEPAEPFPTQNRAVILSTLALHRKEYNIPFSLVGTLGMIMGFERRQGMPEGTLPKQDEPRERFLLDRARPSFRIGIQIRRSWGQGNPRDPGRINEPLKCRTVFTVSVVDEILAT